MYKGIKRLIEGLFDDDILFNDETVDDEINDIKNSIYTYDNLINKLISIIKHFLINNTWRRYNNIDTLQAELINNDESIIFYFKTVRDDNYLKDLIFNIKSNEDVKLFNEFIEILDILPIENCIFKFVVSNNSDMPVEINTNKHFVCSYFDHCIIKKYETEKIQQDIISFWYDDSKYNFNTCTFTDINNIHINYANVLDITNCKNIKDFSFIKNVNNLSLSYSSSSRDYFPLCNSLENIPSCNNLQITYDGCVNGDKNIPVQSLKGLHKGVKKTELKIFNPQNFLYNFSFEGLTEDYLKNFELSHCRFPNDKYTIQLGPYNIKTTRRNWKPTKPQYLGIIKSQDWFLDCYIDLPHKQYNPPQNKEIEKILQKEEKLKNKKLEKEIENQEDLEKMIKIIKTKLKNGESYKSKYNTLHIKELKDKTITYFITNPYRITSIPGYRIRSYEDFINKVIKDSNFRYTDNTTFLYDLIITPVKKEREKLNLKKKVILKLQKEKEKEQKKLEKEQEKQKEKEQKKLIKKISKEISKEKSDNSTNNTNNTNNTVNKDIVIEDYSDKAIAIFGKTYLIRDELKNIGAKYNPRLNRNGSKEPGWIISKRKKQEVENIITNN